MGVTHHRTRSPQTYRSMLRTRASLIVALAVAGAFFVSTGQASAKSVHQGAQHVTTIGRATRLNVGGHNVVVNTVDSNWFFWRSQGVSIQVDPQTHWWCAWLCTTTTSVSHISASIVLTGLDYGTGSGSCNNCGSLNVMGPTYYGFNVPRAFDRVGWNGFVTIGGATYEFNGAALY